MTYKARKLVQNMRKRTMMQKVGMRCDVWWCVPQLLTFLATSADAVFLHFRHAGCHCVHFVLCLLQLVEL